jgi:hypothetical protein
MDQPAQRPTLIGSFRRLSAGKTNTVVKVPVAGRQFYDEGAFIVNLRITGEPIKHSRAECIELLDARGIKAAAPFKNSSCSQVVRNLIEPLCVGDCPGSRRLKVCFALITNRLQ